jgi:enoyl-CoA hydratase
LLSAVTLDEAQLIEGYMAETWAPGTGDVLTRRAGVTARGRSQIRS